MVYKLPKLGYKYDALEPHLDKETMEIHYTKHHQAYIDKLNAALEAHSKLQKMDVEVLLQDLDSIPKEVKTAVRNHGGGHANHSFWWPLLKKDVKFKGEVADAIKKKFGGFDKFKEQFINAAISVFGSGWTWLVVNDDGELEIMTTSNQDSPISLGKKPVLSVDVWEHSYYKKFGPARKDFLEAFFNVINWDQVNKNFNEAKGD